MHAGYTIWWVDAQVDRNWWYLLRATCYSICLIWYFFPHKSCMRLQIPWVMWPQSCNIWQNRRSLLLKLSHQIQVLLWYQARSITWKSYKHILYISCQFIHLVPLPKSVNRFLGRCRNSAYSVLSSVLCNCKTRGLLVTIPAQPVARLAYWSTSYYIFDSFHVHAFLPSHRDCSIN